MTFGWWGSLGAEPRLSQGDVVQSALLSSALYPLCRLEKATVKGGAQNWVPISSEQPAETDKFFHLLAKGRHGLALVLTHSCQLDKPQKPSRVSLAPVALTARLHEDQREAVMQGQKLAYIPLPDVPGLGDCYADLRTIVTLDREVVDAATRLCTMTPAGVAETQKRITGFFMREAGDPQFARTAP